MKTSAYFIDDAPLQILFFDEDSRNGGNFFNSGLGTTWFDYDLHLVENIAEATDFLHPVKKNQRALDLVFISNTIWSKGGEQLVKQIRSNQRLVRLPVYCVAACSHKLVVGNANCMDKDWRHATNCDHYSKVTANSFEPYLAADHPAHLHGVLCGNNIADEVSTIINNMNQYWFNSSTV